jgi:hypothetical protein
LYEIVFLHQTKEVVMHAETIKHTLFDPSGPFICLRRNCWQATIGTEVIAVVAAHRNPGYSNFALHKADLDSLLNAMADGRASGYVAFTALNGNGALAVIEVKEASRLAERLEPARPGPYGDWYLVMPGAALADAVF